MNNTIVNLFLQSILNKISLKWQEKQFGHFDNRSEQFCQVKFKNNNHQKITFNTPLCLRLAQFYSLSPLDIAEDFKSIYEGLILQNHLKKFLVLENESDLTLLNFEIKWSNFTQDNNLLCFSDELLQEFYFDINISNNGWLELTLTDEFLAEYLLFLSDYNFNNVVTEQKKINADFSYIYIYSRFCSILKSAHGQRIINLGNLNYNHHWKIKTINKNIFNCLIVENVDYLDLIKVIISSLEESVYNQKIKYFNVLKNVSQALYKWEKKCNIWGDIKDNNLCLAQAKLVLSAIALRYYQSLCKSVFIEDFPLEL